MKRLPLKIALIRQRYTAFGGAERFVERALKALSRQNSDLTLITRKWEGKPTLFKVHLIAPFYIGRTWRDWSFSHGVRKHLQASRYDLVQSHERIAGCDIYRAGDGVHREWLKQRHRILTATERIAQKASPYHSYLLSAEQKMFTHKRLKAVICNSKMVSDEIQHYFNIPEEKLHVIYSGVDTELFHTALKEEHRSALRLQYDIPEHAPLFLFVGSGYQRKGLAILIDAMKQLPDSCHLIVIGKDKRQAYYQHSITPKELQTRIHFAGPQKNVQAYYGMADVLVLPTLYDPFPNVILEAMACGLPVITSFKSGGSDFIQNGINGFTCDALDLEKLVTHMHTLLDSDTREAMGLANRIKIKPYTLDHMANKLHRLYETLLDHCSEKQAHER